eukprot:TCALIF_05810-PB protein Name:"Similar to PLD3 Phospholipase D3 (Pongo abelii)" AED:0.45 eAED:0.45 QI:0/0.71/0.62/0.87/0.28/0.25/8/155/491
MDLILSFALKMARTFNDGIAPEEDSKYPLLFRPREKPQTPSSIWLFTTVLLSILFLVALLLMSPGLLQRLLPKWDPHPDIHHDVADCSKCRIRLVESIPEGLVYNSSIVNLQTHEAWKALIRRTESSLELASSYWSLRGSDVYEDKSDWQGEDIFKRLVKATEKGIRINIAQNLPGDREPNLDTDALSKIQGVQVRSLNFTALMGAGILHTKLWISDRQHFYVGSANFDWRSLTQVKEMGVLVENCPCLANDMGKIFDVYWRLGGRGKVVPPAWPKSLGTNINAEKPIRIQNGAGGRTLDFYLSSSPAPFCPVGRTVDIEAILSVIDHAKKFIHVAVMDYFPATLYSRSVQFWPIIDDRLRKAAIERSVEVRLLLSHWDHTRPDMKAYILSLMALNGTNNGSVRIEGRFFQVPKFTPDQGKIPFARVNHNKYMVTDQSGYIGTSNWSADYFLNTGGIGLVFKSTNSSSNDLRAQLEGVFQRDWTSAYAHIV